MTRRPARLLTVLATLALTAAVVPAGTAAGSGPATSGDGGPEYGWESIFAGPGLDGTVAAAVVWDDGSGPALYGAGLFLTAGGRQVNRIARWDGGRWSALDGPGGSGANDWVNTLLTVDADGSGPAPERLVAGGHFEVTGGVANWYLGGYGPAALTANPDPLDFGEVTVGETGGPLSLTLTNTGVADVTVEEVSGPLPPFVPAEGGDCGPTPFTLSAQGGSCTMRFAFRPTAEGPATGSVAIVTGAGTGPDPVTLRGTGMPAAGRICDRTITGVHIRVLTVGEGVTCLAAGAQVLGEVDVLPGAGLVATAAVVQGPVSAAGATVVEVRFGQVTGPVVVTGVTGPVVLFGSQVTGGVTLVGNPTAEPATVAGNTVIGSLSCFGNDPAPTDHGLPNTATGGKLGQCGGL
jgi:hypothetical protein